MPATDGQHINCSTVQAYRCAQNNILRPTGELYRPSVKKAATNGGKRRAHRGVRCPLFAQEDDEVFVTGSTLYVGDDGRSNNRRQQNRI